MFFGAIYVAFLSVTLELQFFKLRILKFNVIEKRENKNFRCKKELKNVKSNKEQTSLVVKDAETKATTGNSIQ